MWTLHCTCMRLNTPRGNKTDFLTPKMFYQHPCPFYIEVSPLGVNSLLLVMKINFRRDILLCVQGPPNETLFQTYSNQFGLNCQLEESKTICFSSK